MWRNRPQYEMEGTCEPEGEGWRGGGVNHEKKETGKGGGGYAEVGM